MGRSGNMNTKRNTKRNNKDAEEIRILITTPSFDSGAWIYCDQIINRLFSKFSTGRGFKVVAVGLGKVPHKPSYKVITIPYLSFNHWGYITAMNPVFAILWHLPHFIISAIVSLFFKPDIVISNGFVAILSLLWEKIRSSRLVVLHQVHGSISASGALTRKAIGFLCEPLDLVVANSDDTLNEILPLCSREKIIMAENFAEDFFFENEITKPRTDCLNVLYVGRLDDGKLCGLLLELARRHLNDPAFRFDFVGEGRFEEEIKRLEKAGSNIKYHGYIKDRKTLREIYKEADVVWSYTDENYISMPAAEALACGRPIIVPGISAGTQKPINKSIVPGDVGFIIYPYDIPTAERVLREIRSRGISDEFRERCRQYVRTKYSSRNLDEAARRIVELLKQTT